MLGPLGYQLQNGPYFSQKETRKLPKKPKYERDCKKLRHTGRLGTSLDIYQDGMNPKLDYRIRRGLLPINDSSMKREILEVQRWQLGKTNERNVFGWVIGLKG